MLLTPALRPLHNRFGDPLLAGDALVNQGLAVGGEGEDTIDLSRLFVEMGANDFQISPARLSSLGLLSERGMQRS